MRGNRVPFVKLSDRGNEGTTIPSGAAKFGYYDDGTLVLFYTIVLKM